MANGEDVYEGICDYCGEHADANSTDCNFLSCSFAQCEGGLYHQECLYQFLKANRLEKNRKTGFKCPRGCGKGTKYSAPCPGRISKSHPIIPKSAKKVVAPPVIEPPKPKPTKEELKAAAAKAAKEKAEAAKQEKARKEAAAASARQNGKAAAASTSAAGSAAAAAPSTAAPAPLPRAAATAKAALDKAQAEKEQLAQAKAAKSMLLKELARGGGVGSNMAAGSNGPAAPLPASRAPAASVAAPAPAGAAAWGKSAYEPELPPVPQQHTLGALPGLQQLIQLSERKAATKTTAAPAPVSAAAKASSIPGASSSGVNSGGTAAQALQGSSAQAAPQQPHLDSLAQFPPVSVAARASTPASVASQPAGHIPTAAQPAAPATQQQQQQQQQPIVGLEQEYESEDDSQAGAGTRLTKAQRKNQRRAERKKRTAQLAQEQEQVPENGRHHLSDSGASEQEATGHQQQQQQQSAQSQRAGSSNDSSPLAIPAAAASQAPVTYIPTAAEEQCLDMLVSRKVAATYQQLMRMGFFRWQAAYAVRVNGAVLEDAVQWLLEHASYSAVQLQAEAAAAPAPAVDISQELTHLSDAQATHRWSPESVHQAIIATQGDVQAAIMALAGTHTGLLGGLNGGYTHGSTVGLGGTAWGTLAGASSHHTLDTYTSARSDFFSPLPSGDLGPRESQYGGLHSQRTSIGELQLKSPGAGGGLGLGSSLFDPLSNGGSSSSGSGRSPGATWGSSTVAQGEGWAAGGGSADALGLGSGSRLSGWMRGEEAASPTPEGGSGLNTSLGVWSNGVASLSHGSAVGGSTSAGGANTLAGSLGLAGFNGEELRGAGRTLLPGASSAQGNGDGDMGLSTMLMAR